MKTNNPSLAWSCFVIGMLIFIVGVLIVTVALILATQIRPSLTTFIFSFYLALLR